jgi:hypothetical protein
MSGSTVDGSDGVRPPAPAPAGGCCERNPTCRQIGSFARAQELLRQRQIDLNKNGDWVACESLRSTTREYDCYCFYSSMPQ